MMANPFDSTIEQMEREVRDLKTAHLRGVGTVIFYQESATVTVPANKTMRYSLTLTTGAPSPAVYTVQTAGAYKAGMIETGDTITGTYSGGSGGKTYTLTATSSSEINMTTEIL